MKEMSDIILTPLFSRRRWSQVQRGTNDLWGTYPEPVQIFRRLLPASEPDLD